VRLSRDGAIQAVFGMKRLGCALDLIRKGEVMNRFAVSLAAAVLAGSAAQAHAVFISLGWSFPDSPGAHSGLGWDNTPGVDYAAWCWETDAHALLTPDTHIISGETDEDPILWVSESILNDTAVPWYGYELTASGTGVTFINQGLTTGLPMAVTSFSSSLITFSGVVNPGQTLNLEYYVNVATVGSFSITLVQTPVVVPEPASLSMLAMGAALLLRRRR
jgi:hypothetical protein